MLNRVHAHRALASLACLGLVAVSLGLSAGPARAAQSNLASVSAGGVSANITFSAFVNPVSTCGQCVNVPVQMTTTGPGTLTFQATASGGTVPVTGSLTATAAGTFSTTVQVCPGTNGSGPFAVTGTFSAAGGQSPLPADVMFQVTAATPAFAALTASQKGSRTTIAGQVLIQSTVGMVGATGTVQLSARTPKSLGGTGGWTNLGTATLSAGYGRFTTRVPAAKVPRGATVRATLAAVSPCPGVTQTTPVR